jgi:hypothetical protein
MFWAYVFVAPARTRLGQASLNGSIEGVNT